MNRLPIRIRLTLLFAVIMAAVLVVAGVAIHSRLAANLDATLDRELDSRFATIAAALEAGGSGDPGEALLPWPKAAEEAVQVISPEGVVLYQSGGSPQPVPSANAEPSGADDRAVVGDARVSGSDDPFRLVYGPVRTPSGPAILLVAHSLEDRAEALEQLTFEFLVGGPLVLIASSLLAYLLAGAALRPVEAMRREAEAFSAVEPAGRLSVPPGGDELTRLARTLNDMLGQVEQAIERERSFVADASHELRTPLTLLKMELDLALRRSRSQAELEQSLRSAAAETDRLSRLAENLLVLARADQGRLALASGPISTSDLLQTVARRFAGRAETQGRLLDVRAPEDLVVRGDRLRLEQALGNLVDNALLHGDGDVTLEAAREGGPALAEGPAGDRPTTASVALRVSDQGPGFAADILPRAFDRFARADSARPLEGAGLGLAMVRSIAEAHGGTASAQNLEPVGAQITLLLPADRTA